MSSAWKFWCAPVPDFLTQLFIIVAIDLMLAGDNALVIAMATRSLPAMERRRAVAWGVGLAILIRVALTAGVASLLTVPGLMFGGGVILIWIACRFAGPAASDTPALMAGASLAASVRAIVLADLAMGTDNMLAVGGAAQGDLILLCIGLAVSIPIMLIGAQAILWALTKWPALVIAGAGVLGITAAQMILADPWMGPRLNEGVIAIYVACVVVSVAPGFIFRWRKA